jgi:hypothetical protein
MKIEGSGSGSISQRHGSADPDPDPHQTVMDPQHCFYIEIAETIAIRAFNNDVDTYTDRFCD